MKKRIKGYSYHLRDATDIVITTADEPDQRLPGILLQDAHASERLCFLHEIRVGRRPLPVQLPGVDPQVEILLEQGLRVIVAAAFAGRWGRRIAVV